jgi:hypothetical protein
VFAQHSGSGWLAFAEWSVDGTLLRSHHAEPHDQCELAESVALEMSGFTAESPPDDVVLHAAGDDRAGRLAGPGHRAVLGSAEITRRRPS